MVDRYDSKTAHLMAARKQKERDRERKGESQRKKGAKDKICPSKGHLPSN
jgi:hypothetical protein